SFRALCGLEQLLRRSDPDGLERVGLIRIDLFDGGDGIGHRILLVLGQPSSLSSVKRAGRGGESRRRSRRLRPPPLCAVQESLICGSPPGSAPCFALTLSIDCRFPSERRSPRTRLVGSQSDVIPASL